MYNQEIDNQTFLGKEFPQNCGDSLLVLEKSEKKTKKGESLYRCEFQKFHFEVFTRKYLVIKGEVLNPLLPNIFNKAYVGIGKYSPKNNKNIFHCWYSALSRCYNIKDKKYNVYGAKEVTVCEEWYNFQNFAKWYEENSKWNIENYELSLDKDILYNINKLNNKIYSPDNCILILSELNGFIAGDCLECGISIYERKDGGINYYSRFKSKVLGTFSSFEEAKLIYAKEKYKQWKIEIDKFKIPNDLKNILLKYNFNWK